MTIGTEPAGTEPSAVIAAAVASAALAARPVRASGGQPKPAIVLVDVDAKGLE